MAQLLETLRSAVVDSIKGRKLGLDKDETLLGPKAFKYAVQDITSASSATAQPYGLVVARMSGLATTGAGGFHALSNPIPGVSVTLMVAGTSQAATVGSTCTSFQRLSTAFYIQSTGGSTGVAVLVPWGGSVTLTGITTDAYQVTAVAGSTVSGNVFVTGTS